jgi:valyl-tRNA synthetase
MPRVMSELHKAYEPQAVEDKWYSWWIENALFTADPTSPKPAYSIVIPPPNVTGVLTLGHVLNNTLQDILARRARQTGHEVLWLPGTDHAGIATQTVVERKLRKEEKKTRHDLGRDEFLKRVWEWKEKHGGIIINQLKKLGCSCDWTRERFTMDDAYARKVQEVFVDLHAKGMIYRGKRMVNWCPISLTALSDEEVIPKNQKGFFYHYKVEVVEKPGTYLEIATTRPETIMADAAVAVNPKDPRYTALIGLHVRRPLPAGVEALLPIIGDEAVDFEFGTGVLKVTPAHDKTDYEIGLRHNLPVVDIFNPDATLNDLAGDEFAGLDRFEARTKAVDKLRELGLLVKEEPHENNVGFSERADVPIEPRLSEQWFLKYPKTVEARDAVRKHLIRFFPDRWEKVYDHWLENIQDWCISRQLWWGHRIPVWYPAGESNAENAKCQIESPGDGWVQDSDVLDTWFSSWLWAHETMEPAALAKFFPTSVLVTGPDIIFFWVARMIMASLEYTGQVPFKDVYFTGIIRDKQERKMSKSLGNSPDPLDLIAKYGADGIRAGLLRIAPQWQDIKFDEQQIVEGRNFCNKLRNACRFRQMQGPLDPNADPSKHAPPSSPAIFWLALTQRSSVSTKATRPTASAISPKRSMTSSRAIFATVSSRSRSQTSPPIPLAAQEHWPRWITPSNASSDSCIPTRHLSPRNSGTDSVLAPTASWTADGRRPLDLPLTLAPQPFLPQSRKPESSVRPTASPATNAYLGNSPRQEIGSKTKPRSFRFCYMLNPSPSAKPLRKAMPLARRKSAQSTSRWKAS